LGSALGRTRTMSDAFEHYLIRHDQISMINATISWIEDPRFGDFDPFASGSAIVMASSRCFSSSDVEKKWIEQNYRCWVTGNVIDRSNAQGGHIVPYSKGGKTEYENLVVVSAEHNRLMGETNANDYKALYLAQNKKAA